MASSFGGMQSLMKSVLSVLVILTFFLPLINGHGGATNDDEDTGSADDTHHDLRSKSLILVKIWCLIIFLVSTFVAGVSPYFYRWNESFLLLGTQFAGGVFLGTSLMHFLSDSNESFKVLTEKEYPFAYMLASAGYLLTMMGDTIISFVVKRSEREAKVEIEEVEEAEAKHVNPILLKTSSFGDTLLLILALCFHSIFEDAWRNLWTISLHKIFAAVAMGIALLRMIPKRPFITTAAYSFAFAISSPIGVGIGIAINATTQGAVADWMFAISMGIACGVFIYVAINHLITKGFKPQGKSYFDNPFFKFLSVMLGVGVMAVVMIWD
ncbi:hypothetical protein ACHQM5_013239 [Ranunculus cassubicifolius]